MGREEQVSTRRSVWLWWRFHYFWDVMERAYYLDIGKHSYNHAVKVWPVTRGRIVLY